ncbi:MAG: hypothetical protein GEU83_08065 [Pseudonocardiaceae bacterium]|nr:hypothetical protein [Pseudonocardiaceae bacterium]
MDGEPFDESPSSRPEWLLDRELDIAAEVYRPEPIGPHTPLEELSDAELLERFRSVNGFDLRFE